MDELSREALETVARLRRRGLVSDRCPNAGSCQCPEHVTAPAQPARLRVVTLGPDPLPGCTGDLTCPCERCHADRQGRTAQGAGPSELRVRSMSDRHRRAA